MHPRTTSIERPLSNEARRSMGSPARTELGAAQCRRQGVELVVEAEAGAEHAAGGLAEVTQFAQPGGEKVVVGEAEPALAGTDEFAGVGAEGADGRGGAGVSAGHGGAV